MINDLSATLGRSVFQLECRSNTTDRQVIKAFAGLCQGDLFLFNHFNALTDRCLHLFVQLSSQIHQMILLQRSSFEYLSQTFSLAQPAMINVLCSIAPSTLQSIARLPADLIVDYRLLHLTRPSPQQIFVAHLIQSGFHHAQQLATHLFHLLVFSVQHTMTENRSARGCRSSSSSSFSNCSARRSFFFQVCFFRPSMSILGRSS